MRRRRDVPGTSSTTPSRCAATGETRAAEILFTYDPTPATWMYNWDSDRREDAALAASLGFVYYNFPTTQDAGIGIFADGRSTFAFPGAPSPAGFVGSQGHGS